MRPFASQTITHTRVPPASVQGRKAWAKHCVETAQLRLRACLRKDTVDQTVAGSARLLKADIGTGQRGAIEIELA